MDFLISLVKIIHIVVSLLLIVLVMFQSGKGGGMGAIGGTTTTVLGGGGNTFLVRFAAYLCGIFIFTSASLAYFATRGYEQRLARQAAKLKAEQVQKILNVQEKEAKKTQEISAKIEKYLKETKIPQDKNKDKVTKLHEKAKTDTTVANALLKNIVAQIVSTRVETKGIQSSGDTSGAAKVAKKAEDIKKQIETESNKLKAVAKDLGIKLEEAKKDAPKKTDTRTTPSTRPAVTPKKAEKPADRKTTTQPVVRTAAPVPARPTSLPIRPAPRPVAPSPARPPAPAPVRPAAPAPAPARPIK